LHDIARIHSKNPEQIITLENDYGSYTGKVNNHLRKHGHGKFTWKDGMTFEGEYNQDAMVKGIKTDPNGDVYDGECSQTGKNGFGKYTSHTGMCYEGQYKNDKKHGEGKIIHPDGSSYKGHWEHGLRHGAGTQIDANGDIFDGVWKDDKRHGFGTQKYGNGDDDFVGTWEHGEKIIHEHAETPEPEWVQ
jgi:hypothetical protein